MKVVRRNINEGAKRVLAECRATLASEGVELARWLGHCAGLLGLVAGATILVQHIPGPAVRIDAIPGMAYLESRSALLENLAKSERAASEAEMAKERAYADKQAVLAENAKMKTELGNWTTAVGYSKAYHIPTDLAKDIVDASRKTGVGHDLAFKLINVESQFHEKATSPVGARGLTQVMPGRRGPAPSVNPDSLYSRKVNLVVGLSFLKNLIGQYHGNTSLALVAYNRGPVKVAEVLKACRAGGDCRVSNGYDRAVLDGGHTIVAAER